MASADTKKASLHSEGFNKLDIEGIYTNVLSPVYDKHTGTIELSIEKLKTLRPRTGHGWQQKQSQESVHIIQLQSFWSAKENTQ